MAERVLVLGVLLGLGIVAADEIRQGQFPPRPSRFFGVAVVFSVLAVVAVPAPALAAAFAIAVDVALALRQTPGQASQTSGAGAGLTSQVVAPLGSSRVAV